jgi:hypothetical protein
MRYFEYSMSHEDNKEILRMLKQLHVCCILFRFVERADEKKPPETADATLTDEDPANISVESTDDVVPIVHVKKEIVDKHSNVYKTAHVGSPAGKVVVSNRKLITLQTLKREPRTDDFVSPSTEQKEEVLNRKYENLFTILELLFDQL